MNNKQYIIPEIKSILKTRKIRWLFSIAATQLIPFLEVAFLYSIYLILEPDRLGAFASKVTSLKWIGLNLSSLSTSELISYIFIAGLFLLALRIGLRYANEMNLIKLRYFYYVTDSQRLIHQYLDTNTTLARKTGKEKIMDSIINDCGDRKSVV